MTETSLRERVESQVAHRDCGEACVCRAVWRQVSVGDRHLWGDRRLWGDGCYMGRWESVRRRASEGLLGAESEKAVLEGQ